MLQGVESEESASEESTGEVWSHNPTYSAEQPTEEQQLMNYLGFSKTDLEEAAVVCGLHTSPGAVSDTSGLTPAMQKS